MLHSKPKILSLSADGSPPEEKTEVLHDTDEIIRRAVITFYALRHTCDVCADSIGPSMFVILDHPVSEGFWDMKRRGIRIPFIAEITKDNISSCKELMKAVELRHLDEVKGNFGKSRFSRLPTPILAIIFSIIF